MTTAGPHFDYRGWWASLPNAFVTNPPHDVIQMWDGDIMLVDVNEVLERGSSHVTEMQMLRLMLRSSWVREAKDIHYRVDKKVADRLKLEAFCGIPVRVID